MTRCFSLSATLLLVAATALIGCESDGSIEPTPAPTPTLSLSTDSPPSFSVEDIRPPHHEAGAMAPHLTRGPGGLHLTWIEPTSRGHALRHSRHDGGSWTTPTTVTEGSDWFVNWADVPAFLEASDGTLYATWLARAGEEPYAYHVHFTTSSDGSSWTAPQRLHDDDSATEHGFVALAPSGDGVLAVWLDGALTAERGPMTLKSRTLGPDGRLGAEKLVDDRACDCCPTSLTATRGGALAVWRGRSEAEVRDLVVARHQEDVWQPTRTPSPDGWTINGCPVNGPSVSGHGERVLVAWFTGAEDRPRVQALRSSDGGQTWGEKIVVAEGAIGRVATAVSDEGSWISWVEAGSTEQAEVVAAPVDEDGLGRPLGLGLIDPSRRSGMLRAAPDPDGGLWVVWTNVEEEASSLRLARVVPRTTQTAAESRLE